MLAKMLASSRDAISLITLDGVISFWSAGSEATYGYSTRRRWAATCRC